MNKKDFDLLKKSIKQAGIMKNKKFTIPEIIAYLKSCILYDAGGKVCKEYNVGLKNALFMILQDDCGIEAITLKRIEENNRKRP